MVKKIATIVVLFCMIATAGIFMLEKTTPKNFKIGILNYSPAAEMALVGLKEGLKSQGFIENKNIQFIYNSFITDKSKLHQEGLRLVNEQVDLIYAMSTPATLIAKKITEKSNLPVVFGPVSSPVKAGIVESLSRPGGNITGVTFGPQEPRRLEMLLKIIPGIKKIYVPYNPADKSPRLGIERLKIPAKNLGIDMKLVHAHSKKELLNTLEDFPNDIDAIFIPTDSLMVSLSYIFISFSIKHKIPLSVPQREGVKEGSLYSYGFSIEDVGRQASLLVAKILNGADPKSLPVELSEFILAINLKTAEAIHIDIPEQLLRHAIIYRNMDNQFKE